MEVHRSGDSLELHGSNLGEGGSGTLRSIDHGLAYENLTGPGVVRDARRQVDRLPEVVALLVQHRSGMQADMGRRETDAARLLHHLQGGLDAGAGIAEVEHHAVAEPLDRLAAVLGR